MIWLESFTPPCTEQVHYFFGATSATCECGRVKRDQPKPDLRLVDGGSDDKLNLS